eukprot:CAMPEP_0119548648 /NCGR_PEP_ID=MMETSP1352-20130426/2507_1 /TAXON_ID=265584 /ORGANISM="Stauroneis constricta, Strain CCMP1120" /LENGTH=659 /DNA_ID=CAMNT_0007593969 /DNA_START=78 /DNA_END=2057 /DNA_ORIENTATION=+
MSTTSAATLQPKATPAPVPSPIATASSHVQVPNPVAYIAAPVPPPPPPQQAAPVHAPVPVPAPVAVAPKQPATAPSAAAAVATAPRPAAPTTAYQPTATPTPTPMAIVPSTTMTAPKAAPTAHATAAYATNHVVHTAGATATAPHHQPVASAIAAAPVPVPAPAPVAATTTTTTKQTKSKKKKSAPTVTMATAASAQNSGQGAQGENTGRWTAEEHRLFLQGLDKYGKGWKKIACLIKSRTVVQIRTHAQKYFQKLAKARQNGEEGDVAMDARGGASVPIVNTSTAQSTKRRRQTSGTKRKAIQSVVSSAQRQGKKMAAASGDKNSKPPLPAVAPSLLPFALSPTAAHPSHPNTISAPCVPSITTAQGTISGPALEDSLFRFLTPAQPMPMEPQVSDIARQAGANPITVPSEHPTSAGSGLGGEVSPTGVAELALYPSWTDAKDTPSWYAKGSDVDALLDVAGTLDWLTDTGDMHETYQPAVAAPEAPAPAAVEPVAAPPQVKSSSSAAAAGATASAPIAAPVPAPLAMAASTGAEQPPGIPAPTTITSNGISASAASTSQSSLKASASVSDLELNALEGVDANGDVVVPPLPSLFEDGDGDDDSDFSGADKLGLPTSASATSIDEHLQVFDTPLEEQDFVSTLLDNNGESSTSLPALA